MGRPAAAATHPAGALLARAAGGAAQPVRRMNRPAPPPAHPSCRWVKAHREFVARQVEVMKDVPGYKAEESVYKTRWMPPAQPAGVWGGA